MVTKPPPPPRWNRRKDQRPEQIASAALALFAERGFGATRLEDVAKAAGISKGTVYLYFPTKEDLFQEVVRQELLPTLTRVEEAVAAHDGASADLLRLIAGELRKAMQTRLGAIPRLVLAEAGNFPNLARFYADTVIARGLALLDAVLRRGIARGEFRDVEARHVGPVFMGPIVLLLLLQHSIGRHVTLPIDPDAVLETHLDLLLRALAPEGAPRAAPRGAR